MPTDGWLAPLLGHFDDPLVAAVAPRIVPDPGDGTRGGPVRSSLDRGTREGPVRPGGPIPFVPSAALLVRVDAVSGTDLFDPTLRGGEDVDLVWRLADAGWDVRYVPSSTVVHDGPATLGAFLARRAFYGTTAAALSRRHGDAVAPVHVSGWSLAVWALALARRPLLALTVLAASVALLAHRLRGLVRDPVAVATHIAGGGTVRSAVPALGALARAWSPALVLGLAFRRTRAASALALLVPALADWDSGRETRDSGAPSHSTWRTTLPTGWESGSAAPASGRSSRSSPASRGVPACGPPARCATSCRRRQSRAEAEEDRGSAGGTSPW